MDYIIHVLILSIVFSMLIGVLLEFIVINVVSQDHAGTAICIALIISIIIGTISGIVLCNGEQESAPMLSPIYSEQDQSDSIDISSEQSSDTSSYFPYDTRYEKDELVAAALARYSDLFADVTSTSINDDQFGNLSVLYPDDTRKFFRYELRDDAFEEDKTDVLLYPEGDEEGKTYEHLIVVPTEDIVPQREGTLIER